MQERASRDPRTWCPSQPRWLSPRPGCCGPLLKFSLAHYSPISWRSAAGGSACFSSEKGKETYFSHTKNIGCRLHVLVVNMKGIYRDGYYDGSIELRDIFNRRCVKCGRGDFVQTKTMRIRKGVVFWNLIFSLMFTCVTGTSHCSDSLYYLMRVPVCVCVSVCVRACEKSKALTLQTCAKWAPTIYWMGRISPACRSMQALTGSLNRYSCGSLSFFQQPTWAALLSRVTRELLRRKCMHCRFPIGY